MADRGRRRRQRDKDGEVGIQTNRHIEARRMSFNFARVTKSTKDKPSIDDL